MERFDGLIFGRLMCLDFVSTLGIPSRNRFFPVSTSVSDVQSPDERSSGEGSVNVRSLDSSPSWARAISFAPPRTLAELFAVDEDRETTLVLSAGDLMVDVSRQQVDNPIFEALVSAAQECQVGEALQRMLSGAPINVTEQRSVGHMALRMPEGERFNIDGVDVVPEIHTTMNRMSNFAEGVRSGTLTGATGHAFTAVVNIGIGGSDLGPRMVHDALGPYRHERLRNRFAANVDPEDLAAQLSDLDPARTLIIVSSKTFTTTETLMNAKIAVEWIRSHLGDSAVSAHIVAVSADERAVRASGLGAEIVFPMWDWVGGRYSLGSAVGLSVMLAIGPKAFREILDGMRDIDEHVLQSELSRNAALVMALIGIWNHAVLGYATRAVIPYSYGLRALPAYLQQLIMESNGKSIRIDGSPVALATSPVIWGDAGTNAQHAFMQLLHQGTEVVPVDFIGFVQSRGEPNASTLESQRILYLNMVAQAQALAFGRSTGTDGIPPAPHRTFTGNRPSTIIVAPRLTPRVLGQIIALYEHTVFYEGILLGLDSFDQWGVELGKEMASTLMSASGVPTDQESAAERAGQRLVTWFDARVEPKKR